MENNTYLRILLPIIVALGLSPHICHGLCTYPSDLVGTWYTSHETQNPLVFTSSEITSFDFKTSSNHDDMVMECFLTDGTYYVSKTTTTITVFGAQMYIYTCWSLEKITEDKYIYRIHVAENAQADNARVSVNATTTVISATSDICNDLTVVPGQYSILLKNGTAETAKAACPNPLLATGQYTANDGTTDYCSYASWLDGCSTDGVLTANYTTCAQPLFYSDVGEVYCMYHEAWSSSVASTYYVTVWNTDAAPNQDASATPATWHFACLVVTSSSGGVTFTTHPSECRTSTFQNDTSITVDTTALPYLVGFTVGMTTNTTCVPEESTDILPIIIGAVVGLLVLIALVVLAVWCYKKKYLPSKEWKKRPGSRQFENKVVPDTLPNTAMSQADKNKRIMFTPAPPKSAGPGSMNGTTPSNVDLEIASSPGSPVHAAVTPVVAMGVASVAMVKEGNTSGPDSKDATKVKFSEDTTDRRSRPDSMTESASEAWTEGSSRPGTVMSRPPTATSMRRKQ